jgi:hypothetical protein
MASGAQTEGAVIFPNLVRNATQAGKNHGPFGLLSHRRVGGAQEMRRSGDLHEGQPA